MKLKLSICIVFLSFVFNCFAQDTATMVHSLEVYGFAMTDAGYNANQIDPNWYDALRVSKLPTYANQFAPDGTFFMGIRQSRLGVRGWTQTPVGELKGVFEFDLFGLGNEIGQTAMRLRHVYGELGKWLVGQTNTPFMDGDVFPNTLEYWGPTGMVFFRNIQIRFAPMQGENEIFLALERPGASADQGTLSDRSELDSIKGAYNVPDFSAHYKRTGKWGHIQIATMLREIKWKDISTTGKLNGSVLGWGVDLSGTMKLGASTVFRGAIVHGEGVENYMNDAPVDLGVIDQPANTAEPITGKALPVTGFIAYFDHNWTPALSTAIGYSATYITNTAFASPTAYKQGQYASLNLLWSPFTNFMMGGELQWGERTGENNFSADDTKFQFSFKYSFSQVFMKKK
jgi:hypothetical protein